MEMEMKYDWTIPDETTLEILRAPRAALNSTRPLPPDVLAECARRAPSVALYSDRDLPPDVLADCARREPWAALGCGRELPPEVEAWCKAVTGTK